MADFDPDSYLKSTALPPVTVNSDNSKSAFDPDAYLGADAPEPADHGLSERQKLSPVGKALNPITNYPETYRRMRNEALDQASEGIHQAAHPDVSKGALESNTLWDIGAGAAKTAAGAAGYVLSPATAAYRSLLGQPVEDITGIPREYTEFAAQLATPYLGITGPKTAPKIPPPKPVLPPDPFGVTLTEGERTGDLAARQAEQAALRGQAGKPAQEHAEEFFNEQRPQQLEQAKTDVTKALDTGNQTLAENPAEAANIVQQSVQKEAARSKQAVTSLYDQAKALPGEIHADTFRDMPQGIKTDLSRQPDSVIIDDGTPVSSRMIKYLDDQIGQLNITNRASPTPNPSAQQINGVTLEGVEQWRKNLSRMRGDALASYGTNASDARAANAIINDFDRRIGDAVNSGAFRGDPRAVDLFNQARAAHSERMKIYGNDPAGRKIQAILGDAARGKDPASLNDVANFIYSSSGTSPNSLNVAVAKRLKTILGEDSPEWAAVRQGLFHRLVSTAEGAADRGPAAIANRLSEFVNGKGSDLSGVVFTPAQKNLLNKYADLHNQLKIPQAGANWPNTAAGIIPQIRAVADKVLGAVGAYIGHHLMPGLAGEVGGWMVGQQTAKVFNKAEYSRNLQQVAKQMPLVSYQLKQWQNAVLAQTKQASVTNQRRVALAASNLTAALSRMTHADPAFARLLTQGPSGPGTSNAQEQQRAKGGKVKPLHILPDVIDKDDPDKLSDEMIEAAKHFADGGQVDGNFNTKLGPADEQAFQAWKMLNAPNDSGEDYDLRGAYQAGLSKDPESGHFNDRFKKPNHPTFSDQSQYAVGDQRQRAGTWAGPDGPDQTFVPPAPFADGGTPSFDERFTGTSPDNPSPDDMVDQVNTNAQKNAPDDSWKDREAQAGLALQQEPADNRSFREKAIDEAKSVGDTAQRFGQYTGQMASDIAGFPKHAYEHPEDVKNSIKKLVGMGEGEREQTWPERMVRSGATLAHDVETGEVPTYEQDPKTGEWHTSQQMIERAQDMAGMAGSGGLANAEEGAVLNSTPSLRPAMKYKGRIYKGQTGQEHIETLPDELGADYYHRGMTGGDLSDYETGFINHKGQFMDRAQALDYGIENGLVSPDAKKYGLLTSPILRSETDKPGAAIAGLAERQRSSLQDYVEPTPVNLPATVEPKYEPKSLPDDLQNFLKLAQSYESKLGPDWTNKLTPEQAQELKANPAMSQSLANIVAAKAQGVFNKVLDTPINRRSLFGGAATLATTISNASKIAGMLEKLSPPAPVGPSAAEQALTKIGSMQEIYKPKSDAIVNAYYKAEQALKDKAEAEKRDVAKYWTDQNGNWNGERSTQEAHEQLRAIDRKYQPEHDRLQNEMNQNHRALKEESQSELATSRQDLNLPKLSDEQQRVLDYVVQNRASHDFADSRIRQNPYSLREIAPSDVDLYERFHNKYRSNKDEAFNIPYLLHKMSPEQKADIAEHIKPALLQDPDLSLKDMRTIAKAFPSLKGFALFADSQKAGAPLAALEHAQPFYSAVEKTVESAPQQKMHGVQWANWLKNQPGVKPDELQYTGVDNWLREQKGPVTKQQVQDYIGQNKVQVGDVVKGEGTVKNIDLDRIHHQNLNDLFLDYAQTHDLDEDQVAGKFHEGNTRVRNDLRNHLKRLAEGDPSDQRLYKDIVGVEPTKYSSYQLPGGDNYREHLLTLPRKVATPEEISAGRARTDESGAPVIGDAYRSSHWDEPNVLAHVRTNERDVAGKPSLHIEEIQGDWGQTGRKRGFKTGEPPPKPRNWMDFMAEKGFTKEEAQKKWGTRYEPEDVKLHNEHNLEVEDRTRKLGEYNSGVPDMPFKQTEQWASLALKRMIQRAAAEGKSRVSWTPGEAQAARYDLSKQIKELRYTKNEDGTYELGANNNPDSWTEHHIGSKIPESKLADYVGKDVADKIVNDQGKEAKIGDGKILSAVDLKVGGTGMKGFYDQMLPKMVEKLGKQYGVKVKEGQAGGQRARVLNPEGDVVNSFDDRATAQRWLDRTYTPETKSMYKIEEKPQSVKYFDIPEKMKQDVLSKGFPLFSDSAKPGAALAGLESRLEALPTIPMGERYTGMKHLGLNVADGMSLRRPKDITKQLKTAPERQFDPKDLLYAQNYLDKDKVKAFLKNPDLIDSAKQPMTVLHQGDKYILSDGTHRAAAAHLLDRPITAKVIEARKLNDAELKRMTPTQKQRYFDEEDKNEKDVERPKEEKPAERAAGGRVVASNINHSPTEAQKSAGNYAKDHINIHGLSISIENAKGSKRRGVGKDGKAWETTMPSHYGHFVGHSKGADGDHVDVYLGPHIKSKQVFIVNQIDKDTKKFDEHKCCIGFGSLHQALNTYKKGFSDGKGADRIGSIVQTDIATLKHWLKHHDTAKAFVLN